MWSSHARSATPTDLSPNGACTARPTAARAGSGSSTSPRTPVASTSRWTTTTRASSSPRSGTCRSTPGGWTAAVRTAGSGARRTAVAAGSGSRARAAGFPLPAARPSARWRWRSRPRTPTRCMCLRRSRARASTAPATAAIAGSWYSAIKRSTNGPPTTRASGWTRRTRTGSTSRPSASPCPWTVGGAWWTIRPAEAATPMTSGSTP